MKKIIFVFCLVLAVQLANAQSPINLGVKAGYTSSKISTDASQFDDGSVSNYLAGAFLRLNLGKLYLQPEAYFTSKGGKLSETLGSTTDETVNSFDLKTVDVPVLLGYKIINKGTLNLRVNAGPVLSFVTDKESSVFNEDFEVSDLKDNMFGWQYGAGVDFLFLSLDARVENTGDIFKESDTNEKSKVFVVSLGVKLF